MTDALNRVNGVQGLPAIGGKTLETGGTSGVQGKAFKQFLMESLEQVNKLQQEADAKVENLLAGRDDNVVEVFSAVRKADVAFSLLMEIRNKMLEAYQEIQQMRI